MLSCEDCEHFARDPDGSPLLMCDPFSNILDPSCLVKWQVFHLGTIARSHEATLEMHKRLAPLQEKMIRHMEREIDEVDEADQWKYIEDDEEEDDDSVFR